MNEGSESGDQQGFRGAIKGKIVALAGIAGVAVGGLAGYAIGAASAPEVTSTSAYKDVAAERDAALAAEKGAEEGLVKAEANFNLELQSIEGDLPDREAEIQTQQEDLDAREAKLDKARRTTLKLLNDVERRERAVGIVERTIARNTITEGVWRVGTDVAPGTYRSLGNHDCYWMISSDANGSNILQNNIVTGPALVSLSAGTFFTSSGCSKWTPAS